MEYWHDILTEKSWAILKEIRGRFNFILIGGWATYLWGRTLKSRDIDIVVDLKTLEKIKDNYELRKNDRLKKYEIKIEEIDIDIYVPFYSKLAIPLEDIKATKIEGFDVVKVEELIILKQHVEVNRSYSEKGEKDRIDIISLLFNSSVDFNRYFALIKKNKIEFFLTHLIKIVKEFKELKYLNLTPREFKLKKKELLDKIKKL